MLAAFRWIEAQRAKTKADKAALGYGLFPAGKAHDLAQKDVRFWCFTDGFLYLGVQRMADTFVFFNDPLAPRITAAAKDYRHCLEQTLARLYMPQRGKAAVFITNDLNAPGVEPPCGTYFSDGPSVLLKAGILQPESRLFAKVERYYRGQQLMKNGLTGFMGRHVWYTSFSDQCWFDAWLKRGDRHKAAQALSAQLRYNMSREFYMQERYKDDDPTWCPWQPNASANGRMIHMLLDFYGTTKSNKQKGSI